MRRLPTLLAALLLPACGGDSGGHHDPVEPLPPPSGGAVAPPGLQAVELDAVLGGGQEAPPVLSFGKGTATFRVSADRARVDFSLDVSGLTGITMAHVHVGPVGADGPIVFNLSLSTFTGGVAGTLTDIDLIPRPGVTTFAAAVDALLRGALYVNVHTLAYPDGEIRGQIGPVTFRATLTGAEVLPAVATSGVGASTFVLNDDQTELTFTLDVADLSGPPVGAGLYIGPPGLNGPAIFDLSLTTFATPLQGTLTASDLRPAAGSGILTFEDAVSALLSGNAFVKVRTLAHPSGEIRGQLRAALVSTSTSAAESAVAPTMVGSLQLDPSLLALTGTVMSQVNLTSSGSTPGGTTPGELAPR